MVHQNKDDSVINNLKSRYERAGILEQGVFTKTVAFNTTLYPHWIGDSDSFWYTRETRTGQTYRLVNAKEGTNTAAFDHEALTLALTQAAGESLSADNLLLADIDFSRAPTQISFSALGKCWCYYQHSKTCEEAASFPQSWKLSPDGKKAVFVRDYNLWVKDLASGEEKALTHDGERLNEYALASFHSVSGKQGPSPTVEALWSPDSKRLFTLVIDIRRVNVGPPLVQHVPTDGSLRPKILMPDRRVAFSGDKHIEEYQFLAIEVANGNIQRVHYRPCPVMSPSYVGYFTGGRGWWDNDNRHAYFIDQERGGKVVNLVKFDTHTGDTDILITEASDSMVTLIPTSHMHTLLMPLPESNELIWFSERSGWAHFYLYDTVSGTLKNPITSGDWLVRNILHFDTERRELIIQAAGRVQGRNPYYRDICKVNIDSGELFTIISSDHEYIVCDSGSSLCFSHRKSRGVSPSGRYLVTTRSRVDEIPVSLLLDRNGNERLILETADVSGLPVNWQWPEPVMLKAADGFTDIDGVIFRPSTFDPDKLYPVVDCSYNYVSVIGSFTNNSIGNRLYLSAAAYAELGFIVVCVNNRGNSGLRDVAFNTYQDSIFPQNPQSVVKTHKADVVAAIKQLAKRYNYMDISRVGIVEFCSMPMAIAGMLVQPDFYKVGVSINGLADSRLLGAVGMEQGDWPEYADLAENLRGKLLIITGMLDWAIPAAAAFRLIEALQKANKRFDMLMLPNFGHGLSSYSIQRSWDYVVEHLQGLEPPDDFKLMSYWDTLMESELKLLEGGCDGE